MLSELVIAVAVNLALWAWVACVPTIVVPVRRLHLGARGLALPGLVLVTDRHDTTALQHELVHQQQMRRWSPLVVAAMLGVWYAGAGLTTWVATGRRPSFLSLWEKNPLEREANAAARDRPLPRLLWLDLRP